MKPFSYQTSIKFMDQTGLQPLYGVTFEKICTDYLYSRNAKGELPFLFTTIGRWWGTNPQTHEQVEIDIIANEQKDYLIGECKWRNEKLDIGVLDSLREKADIFCKKREHTWFVLFSKSGFTFTVLYPPIYKVRKKLLCSGR